jgi:hypothetical protein
VRTASPTPARKHRRPGAPSPPSRWSRPGVRTATQQRRRCRDEPGMKADDCCLGVAPHSLASTRHDAGRRPRTSARARSAHDRSRGLRTPEHSTSERAIWS